jgi:predicted double-glycine peptidase
VDELYARHLQDKGVGEFTSLSEMETIGQQENLSIQRTSFADETQALEGLRVLIRQGIPLVALVNYAKWDEIAKNNFTSGHFVVVTGIDEDHVLVHDPLFRGPRRSLGEFFVWRNQVFLDGWGSGHEIGNPNFTILVPDKQVSRM